MQNPTIRAVERPDGRAVRRAQRAAQLTDAALECISTLGLRETTVQDVAARAGMAVGSISQYFDSKEMLFTARAVTAGRMAAYGVVNAVVPAEEVEGTTADLAADIAASSPLVLRIMKEELRVLSNAHPLTPESYERIQAIRREGEDVSFLAFLKVGAVAMPLALLAALGIRLLIG